MFVQRERAGRKPFDEVQSEIKAKLAAKQYQKQLAGYLNQLKNKTQVWSAFDQPQGLPNSDPAMVANPRSDSVYR